MLTAPKLVSETTEVTAHLIDTVTGPFVRVQANGVVPTSGWSGVHLSPWYYINPPTDGIVDFDFAADPPTGLVLQVVTPVSAEIVEPAPDWLKGVRVRSASNAIEAEVERGQSLKPTAELFSEDFGFVADNKRAIFSQEIAVYDDSHQPIGFCSGFGSIKMKKLRHRLVLTIEGPDENKAKQCFREALAAGLVAGIIAVFITGGAALQAAIAALKTYLISCLGKSFDVRVDRRSHWIEWCT